MALFIRQEENRSQFQEKLAAELQQKAKQKAQLADQPDGVEDSEFINGTIRTTKNAWIWVLIIVVIVSVAVYLTVISQIG